ncbi:MAG: hypothetical protein IJU81_02585 [Bacteroidales bacterium]|nr:hypothetical protein [Bacteroidales bacterium]
MSEIKDDASAWFESLGQEIQDYQVPDIPQPDPDDPDLTGDTQGCDPQRPYAETPEVTDTDLRNVQNLREISRPTALVIVGTMDTILPAIGTMAIKGSQRDDLRLTPDEHDTLVEAWTAYLAGKSVQVSPGAALLLAILTIYGAKAATAVSNSRTRDQLQQQQQQIEQLQSQLQDKQQEIDNLRRDTKEID